MLEYVEGGDLMWYMSQHEGGLSETQARGVMKQLVDAVKYCHSQGVSHRGMSCAFVLILSADFVSYLWLNSVRTTV